MRFYIRVINLFFLLFPKSVNKCLVIDGFKKPYICNTTDIRGNLSFKEIKI